MNSNAELIKLLSEQKSKTLRLVREVNNLNNKEIKNENSNYSLGKLKFKAVYGDIFITTSDIQELITPINGGITEVYGDLKLVLDEGKKHDLEIAVLDGNIIISKLVASSLSINVFDGDVFLEDCFLESLTVNINDGNIQLKNVVCGDFNISANDGDIQLKKVLCKNGKSLTEDGDIKLSNVAASEELRLITEDGDISGKDIAAKTFIATSDDGDIILERVVYENEAIHSLDGDIKIKIDKECQTNHIYSSDGYVKIKYFKKKK